MAGVDNSNKNITKLIIIIIINNLFQNLCLVGYIYIVHSTTHMYSVCITYEFSACSSPSRRLTLTWLNLKTWCTPNWGRRWERHLIIALIHNQIPNSPLANSSKCMKESKENFEGNQDSCTHLLSIDLLLQLLLSSKQPVSLSIMHLPNSLNPGLLLSYSSGPMSQRVLVLITTL